MAAVAAQYSGKITVVGVPGRGSRDALLDFVQDTGTGDLIHLVDSDGSLWQRFGVVAQPAFAFVDDGTVWLFPGSLDEQELRRVAERLLTS